MFRKTKSISRSMFSLYLVSMVVACTNPQDTPAKTFGDPIEGGWLLGNDQTLINIAPCSRDKEDGFCGSVRKASEEEDSGNSHASAKWWQTGPSPLVTELRPTQTQGEYLGFIYNSEIDETLYLQLVLKDDSTVDAVSYFGTNLDEAVDIAIGAVFSPVEMADVAWFLARAGVGKTWLSSEETWRRPAAKTNGA